MTIDANKIAERALGRELAKEILRSDSLLGLAEQSFDMQLGFWREVQDNVPPFAKPEQPRELMVMGDGEAQKFEKRFSKFGKRYGDVPIRELAVMADQAVELQAYLRSSRGKKRIEDEE